MHPERLGRLSPPSIRHEGKHTLSANFNHDEISRLDFQMIYGFYLAQNIFPGTKLSWENIQKNKFKKNFNRLPKSRIEIRSIMKKDSMWQMWSSLKRINQEINFYIRGEVISRQEENIKKKFNYLLKKNKKHKKFLKIKTNFIVPVYINRVDIHCMPGGYNSDQGKGLFSGSNYDTASLYLATGGELGKWNDGAGWANILFLKENFNKLNPSSILDLGCSVGHSTLPLKEYWPKAKVFAIDSCAPLLRFAYGRSQSLKKNIYFFQQNAEKTEFPDESFDIITSSMFMHEIPQKNLKLIGKEIYRLLKPGGIMLHNEQPQYHNQPPIEQFLREWDTWFNNEPMRCAFRDMDLRYWVKNSGFCINNFSMKISDGANKISNKLVSTKNGSWFILAAQK